MRGDAEHQSNMPLAGVPDSFIPDDHPIRAIRSIVEAALARLSPQLDTMDAATRSAACPHAAASMTSASLGNRRSGTWPHGVVCYSPSFDSR